MMLRRQALHFWLFFVFLVGGPASSQATAPDLRAAKIRSGEEFELTDGRIVHLRGIKTPPIDTLIRARAARQEVEQLVQGKSLTLTNVILDRYGRLSADVAVTADSHQLWLQDQLLKDGLAFLYPPLGDEPRLQIMRQNEIEAREAKRGIWTDAAYGDIPSDKVSDQYGHFIFARGLVTNTSDDGTWIILTFGSDPHGSLRALIAKQDLPAWMATASDPLNYKGMTLRIRGWVLRRGGPAICLTSPAQIEILELPPLIQTTPVKLSGKTPRARPSSLKKSIKE